MSEIKFYLPTYLLPYFLLNFLLTFTYLLAVLVICVVDVFYLSFRISVYLHVYFHILINKAGQNNFTERMTNMAGCFYNYYVTFATLPQITLSMHSTRRLMKYLLQIWITTIVELKQALSNCKYKSFNTHNANLCHMFAKHLCNV